MSSPSIPKFDVFLSFSAEDIAKTFVQDLYRSLSEKGVRAYHKDDKLEAVDYELTRCILESRIVVVVISRSYPTSVLCLNQLETIINSHEHDHFPVLPIFYGVDRSNVRKQTGEFEKPFRKLGEEYPAEKVQKWRTALTKLTNISSLESRYWNIEAKAIEFITKEVLLLISDKPKATKDSGLVALDRHMQTLYKLLDLQSKEEVRLIGIWGLGGVGKTTLARYAYKELSTSFHVHMFVDNAAKIFHQDHHLTSKDTQKGAQTAEKSSNLGYDVIKSTIGHRKGLLVIDCVDNVKHIKDIENIVGWCGPGSRVILVTEEKSLLVEFGVKHVYQVKSLRYHEALLLFSQSAFNQKIPPSSFESLSFRAVQVADFLPLTLKILGSSLQGKNYLAWERELKKLEGDQDKAITKALTVNGDVAQPVELKTPIPSAFPKAPASGGYVTRSQLYSHASSRLSSQAASRPSSQMSSRLSSQKPSQGAISSQGASRHSRKTPFQAAVSSKMSSTLFRPTPSHFNRHRTIDQLFPVDQYLAGYSSPTIGQAFPSNASAGACQSFPTLGQTFPSNASSGPFQIFDPISSYQTTYQPQTGLSRATNRHPPTDEHPTTDLMDNHTDKPIIQETVCKIL